MSVRVPSCLLRFPQNLDMKRVQGQPSGVARLVLVLLMLHGDAEMFSWVGRERLAKITGHTTGYIGKALRLLVDREAIKQWTKIVNGVRRHGWRVRLEPESSDGPHVRPRVFWPYAQGLNRAHEDETRPIRALLAGPFTHAQIAAIVMLYQFSRSPEITTLDASDSARQPRAPNLAWVARVLGVNASTVHKVRRLVSEHGLATKAEDGTLEFVDPGRWPEIMGCPNLLPIGMITSQRVSANGPCYREPVTRLRVVSEPDTGPTVDPKPDTGPTVDPVPDTGPTVDHEAELADLGWIVRWGPDETRERLAVLLAGPEPTYALESLGHALGPEFECPLQLVPACSDSDNVGRTGPHGACYDRPRHVRDFPNRAPPFAGPAE